MVMKAGLLATGKTLHVITIISKLLIDLLLFYKALLFVILR